jgi:hypothetical protein
MPDDVQVGLERVQQALTCFPRAKSMQLIRVDMLDTASRASLVGWLKDYGR